MQIHCSVTAVTIGLEPEIAANYFLTDFTKETFIVYFIVYKMVLNQVYGYWNELFTKLIII